MAHNSNSIGVIFSAENGNEYVLSVSNAREVYGHDDSFPFNAEWALIDRKTNITILDGAAWDTGWGGEVEYVENHQNYALVRSFSEELKKVFQFRDKHYNFVMSYDFQSLVGILALLSINNRQNGIYESNTLLKYLSEM